MMITSRQTTGMTPFLRRVYRILPVFLLLLGSLQPVLAANETFATGSYVIDMGLSPQKISNALKPYGLVQDLVVNNSIPVAWVINPVKARDGIDFSHNGKDYRTGPFVIPAGFAAQAAIVIQDWVNNRGLDGSVVNITVSPITVPVYETITVFPRAVLDLDNGDIAARYLVNAGVDPSFYRIDTPAGLSSCDDVYTMPHADPTWATHENLVSFNQQGGFIWAACHAVSVMENVDDPGDADSAPDMNFLSNDGLVDFGAHNDGSPPYTYAGASDPIMQFLGVIDAATTNGSEQIYLPLAGGWRASTTIGVWDPDNAEVGPSPLSPGKAAIIAYGPGFGNSSNGLVLYEAGHDHNKTAAAPSIGAQRAYLNFMLQTGIVRRPQITATVPPLADPLDPLNLDATVAGGSGGPYTYAWADDCGGTFSDPSLPNPVYTTPATTVDLTCLLTVSVEDTCTHSTFTVEAILIQGVPDLAITKSDSQDPVPTNGTLIYTLDVSNSGSDAGTVTVSDVLPTGTSYVSAVPSTGSCSESSGTVSCNLGTLITGAAESIVITVTTQGTPASISNTATVSSPDGDLDLNNNTATETTEILPEIDLALAKSVLPMTVGIGDTAIYTLTATNKDSLIAATNVVITDVLPAGVSYVSTSGSGWSCSYTAPNLSCQLASLAANSSSQLDVTVTALTSGTQINAASVASTDFADSNIGDNSASASLMVQAAADLAIIKTTDKIDAADNARPKFYLDVSNDGPDTASNVVVTDTLPFSNNKNNATGFKEFYDFTRYFFTFPDGTRVQGGSSVRQVTHNGITITVDYSPATTGAVTDKQPTPLPADGTSVTITWTVSPGLDSGDTLRLEFEAKKVNDSQAPNGATVSSSITDPDAGNNSDSILVGKKDAGGTNVKYADLEVQKSAALNPQAADDPFNIINSIEINTNFSYVISVLNNGPDGIKKGDAGNGFSTITVVDTLPVGVTYLGFTELGAGVGHSLPGGDLEGGAAVKKGTWSCSFNAPTREVTCTYTLDQGDNFDSGKYAEDLIINVTSPGTGGIITNTADQLSFNVPPAVSGDFWTDPYDFNNTSSYDLNIIPLFADLSINKNVDNSTPVLGDLLTYTITVTNNGPENTTGVSILDNFIAGLDIENPATDISVDTGTATYDEPSRNLTWDIGVLANQSVATMTVLTRANLTGSLPNTASIINSDLPDNNSLNDSSSITVTVDPFTSNCVCGFDDGLFTQTTITMDGDLSDWAVVLADSDNVSCDEAGPPDRDYKVQSTGRDLLKFAFTWDSNNVYAYTQRLSSSTNIQKFIYYLDRNNDGLMANGEPVIVARWHGSNRNVSLYIGTYVPAAPGGDPLEDGAGYADGYDMPGTLTGLPSQGNPDYSGTWGATNGVAMEWSVPWSALGASPDASISWHVSSTNSEPSAPSLPAQIDDNMGGCGGCTASTQFAALTFTPDNAENVLPSLTYHLPHSLTNDGNGNDTFNLASTVTGDITPTSIDYYEDLGTIGQYDPGIDVLLTDTNSDAIPDTGLIISGGSINLLVAIGMPGAPLGLSAQVVTTATSGFLPACGTVPPASASVTDTLTGGIQVSGTVWSDNNHDGILDAAENGIATITVVLHDTGAGTCQSVQTDASGDYTFTGVADGSYEIIEAAGESVPVPGSCPASASDPAGHLSTTPNLITIDVAGTDISGQDFGDFHGSRFEGNVFEDNGTGGGTAHDGSINGSETGLTGVAVQATNGATLDSATTGTDGGFALWVPDAASGANVDILSATPGSFISVSKSDGGAGDSAAATALDQISVIPVSGQVYSGLTFGDAREPAFAPDNSRSASPGSTLFYAHTFTAYTSGTVSFSTAGLNATPNVPGWNAVLYNDTNCSGTLEQGEPVHSASIAMDADTTNQVCLIVQVFVPASAPANAQYLVTLAATFSYDATSITTIRNRTDLTTVGDSSLVLVKVVDKPTAQPGELLTYTITYTNAGSDALSTIVIDDKTPAFTTFNSASCILPLSANLTGCSASIQPAIGATGPIQWTFNPGDTLQSGSSGQLQYQVTVDN